MIDKTKIPVYPGKSIQVGSDGNSVLFMQEMLNYCATRYTAITKLNADGKFGHNTKTATILFQKQFSLSADGIIGELTWNKIIEVTSAVYSANPFPVTTEYGGIILGEGSQGDYVRFVQSYLSIVMNTPLMVVDGIYGSNTVTLVGLFQSTYKLSVDGKVGHISWNKMIEEFNKEF